MSRFFLSVFAVLCALSLICSVSASGSFFASEVEAETQQWLTDFIQPTATAVDVSNYTSIDALYQLASTSDIHTGQSTAPHATEEDVAAWTAWKANNQKQFGSEADDAARFIIFVKNSAWIKKMNKKNNVFSLRGPFAATHHSDFKQMYLSSLTSDMLVANMSDVHPATPESQALYDQTKPGLLGNIDYRGICTGVKNQGGCGGCWAFSATETLESAWAKAGRGLPTLAPQQLIDCNTQGNNGCHGGNYVGSFNYWQSHGSTSESSYPYQASQGACRIGSGGGPRVRSSGYPIQPCQGGGCGGQNENGMASGLGQYGPLSIVVAAGVWQHYGGGVLTPGSGCSGNWSDMDHAVQLVGAIDGVWLVRNSWGAGWGEGGYIRIQMMHNICGVANFPAFVTV